MKKNCRCRVSCRKHPSECKRHCTLCHSSSSTSAIGKRKRAPEAIVQVVDGEEAEWHEEVEEEEGDDDVVHVEVPENGPAKSSRKRVDWKAVFTHLGLSEQLVDYLPAEVASGQPASAPMQGEDWIALRDVMTVVAEHLASALSNTDSERLLAHMCRTFSSQDSDVLASAAVEALLKAPSQTSLSSRHMLALLSQVGSLQDVRELARLAGNGRVPQVSNELLAQGRIDFRRLQNGLELADAAKIEADVRQRQVLEDKSLFALRFFLSPEHVECIAWGYKNVQITDDEMVRIPLLMCKYSPNDLYERYLTHHEMDVFNEHPPLDRTTAIQTIKLVFHGDTCSMNKFARGELVLETFQLLERVINFFTEPKDRKELHQHAAIVSHFLSNQFSGHAVISSDSVCTHGLKYALDDTSPQPARTDISCKACKFVLFFFKRLAAAVGEFFDNPRNGNSRPNTDLNHVLDAIDKCEAKVKLWQTHCVAVVNQQVAVNRVHKSIEADALSGKWMQPRSVIVVSDYFSKFAEFFHDPDLVKSFSTWQRCWHGFMVIFYVYNPETKTTERGYAFCHQFLSENKHTDGATQAALLETFLQELKSMPAFTSVKTMHLLTDNEPFYRNEYYLHALPFIGKTVGIEAKSLLCTAKKGSGLLESHFVDAMSHINKASFQGKAIATPWDLFKTLSEVAPDSLLYTFCQFVSIDRKRILQLCKSHGWQVEGQQCTGGVLPRFRTAKACMEIKFSVKTDVDEYMTPEDPFSWRAPIKYSVRLVSNIGPVHDISINGSSKRPSSGGETRLKRAVNHPEPKTISQINTDERGKEEEQEQGKGNMVVSFPFGAQVVAYTMLGVLRHEEIARRHNKLLTVASGMCAAPINASIHLGDVPSEDTAANVLVGLSSFVEPMYGHVYPSPRGGVTDLDFGTDAIKVDEEITVRIADVFKLDRMSEQVYIWCVRNVNEVLADIEDGIQVRDVLQDQPEYDLATHETVDIRFYAPGWAMSADLGEKAYGKLSELEFWKQTVRKLLEQDNVHDIAAVDPKAIVERLASDPENTFRLDLPPPNLVKTLLKRLVRDKTTKQAAATPPVQVSSAVSSSSSSSSFSSETVRDRGPSTSSQTDHNHSPTRRVDRDVRSEPDTLVDMDKSTELMTASKSKAVTKSSNTTATPGEGRYLPTPLVSFIKRRVKKKELRKLRPKTIIQMAVNEVDGADKWLKDPKITKLFFKAIKEFVQSGSIKKRKKAR